jgi:hypothetical protein
MSFRAISAELAAAGFLNECCPFAAKSVRAMLAGWLPLASFASKGETICAYRAMLDRGARRWLLWSVLSTTTPLFAWPSADC